MQRRFNYKIQQRESCSQDKYNSKGEKKDQVEVQRLREGVFRDLERQERKKENLQNLEEQIILTKKLEADRLQISTLASGSSQQSSKQ
ncbi:protein PET117 homolog, mitochondrial [Scyliorhinus canicula]|uniref:protein PET117 homolog, mitochondrial n=1 Tax=Scyliorhinus canicula TaxID=7830 RepID=UPI0018F3A9D7|nr:protein PET117 homolog, mitochondrial [Scyliorhinus canicula]